jgi:hypothetical protein
MRMLHHNFSNGNCAKEKLEEVIFCFLSFLKNIIFNSVGSLNGGCGRAEQHLVNSALS